MNEHKHQEELVSGISEQLKDIFEGSEQAIYVYLDDVHKVCNQKFASLLGYASPEEWARVQTSFPTTFVAEKSRKMLVETYQDAMDRMAGASVKVTWKKKNGEAVDTNVILVPQAYNRHFFALHFISEI